MWGEFLGINEPCTVSVATPEKLTVISWSLPHREATKSDNRKEARYSPERWAGGRIYGQELNVKLRNQVVAVLREPGNEIFINGMNHSL